jgi:MFS family permease
MTLHPSALPEESHRKSRILSVVAGTLIALACGTNYGFSAWAPSFAERLNLSATEMNIIGNAGNLGMYAMGIPAGLLIDSRGPRWGVLLGCICLACGYFPLHRAYEASGQGYSVGLLCFFGFLTGVGSCSAFSASIKTCATNWPRHRGTATAFPLSGFGLSAFLFTFVSGIAFPDDTAGLLLLLSVGTFCMVFVGMLFLRIIPASSPYEAVPADERPGYKRTDSNPLVRTRSGNGRRNSDHSGKDDDGKISSFTRPEYLSNATTENANEASSLVSSPTTSFPDDINDRKHHHLHHHTPDITGFALTKTPKFWQLFIMLGLLCGVGLMSINNIGNVAKALWYHYDDSVSRDFVQKRQLMHVGIISFCSFIGRLTSGIGSDWLIHHHASRFWTLVSSACIFTAAQVVGLTLQDPNELFLLSGLTGLAYGALFGVYPALVADAFGPSGMGINWGAMTMAPVISGNVFNLVYGSILDKHSYSNGGDGSGDSGGKGELICSEGRECYASAYYLTLVSSVVGVAWSLWCIRHEKLARLRDAKAGERPHEG